MIKIRYCARLGESLGLKSENIPWEKHFIQVEDIIKQLITRGEVWAKELTADSSILVAINQQMSTRNATVEDGDEIAFFPPVTGG